MTTRMSIPKPDVTVTVTTRTVTPTVATPALPPVILGPCYFILDPQLSAGLAVNPDAKISLPAMIQGFYPPATIIAPPGLVGGITLALNVGGIPVSVSFLAATAYTPAQIVTAINQALATKGVSAVAEIVGTGSKARFRLRTSTKGSGTYIIWDFSAGTDADIQKFCGITGAEGLMVPRTWRSDGVSFYDQSRQIFGYLEYPDPRGLIASLDIDTDSVRVFGSLSGGLSEWLKTTAVVRCGAAKVMYTDDGDADGYTNLVVFSNPGGESKPSDATSLAGALFTDADLIEFTGITPVGQAAIFAGACGDNAVGGDLMLELNGFAAQIIPILTTDGPTDIIGKINARFPAVALAPINALSFNTNVDGVITLGPSVLATPTGGFTSRHKGTWIVITGSGAGNNGTYLITSVLGATQVEVSPAFPAPELAGFTWTHRASYISLNAGSFVANLATSGSGMEAWGRESYIKVSSPLVTGAYPLLDHLFANDVASVLPNMQRGKWYPLAAGSQLYVEGVFVGNVIEILTDRLKLDREVPQDLAAVTRNFYIVATALAETMISEGPAGINQPAPDLFVASANSSYATEGTVRISPELLRVSVNGQPQVQPLIGSTVFCDEVLGYTGLRLDVTPTTDNPDLLEYSNATDLVADLAPIDTSNPLALGLYFALVNSPGLSVYGLGVDEVSTAYPEGTLESYTECAEFLEARDVYSVVPLTHNEDVAKMLQIHVDAMSAPEMKGERILWWNPSMPVRERSLIIASGAAGNAGVPGALQMDFNSGLPDLPARFTAAGIPLPTANPETDMVFIQLASQGSKMFAVLSVVGPLMKLSEYSLAGAGGPTPWTAPYTGSLDGVFEASFGWTGALVTEPFTVGKLGASLYNSLGKYDKDKAANAINDLGQEFADRRVRMLIPDEVVATIGGLEQAIDGYYACCCLAGMKSANSPSQGFTNMRIAGIDRVQRTEGYFKASQLNTMAGGGAWILIPGPGGGGVITRMSLTTDVSSVEFRQDSWTSAIDYGAKYMRTILRRIIGPTNITQAAIDLVASLVDSSLRFLIDNRIWTDGTLQTIEQSAAQPDSLDVGVTARIPYNLMYINVTITV